MQPTYWQVWSRVEEVFTCSGVIWVNVGPTNAWSCVNLFSKHHICVTGLEDLDKFDSSEEMKRFALDEGCSKAADLVYVLFKMGFRSCAALERVRKHNARAFGRLLDPPPTSAEVGYLHTFASNFQSKQGFL